ncbi:MAG: S-layer homology domain-containing protein, partial [bacterium]
EEDNKEEENTPNVDGEEDNKEEDDVVEDNKNSSSSSSASSSSSSGSGGSNSSSSLGSASSLNTANTSGLDNIASIKFELKISNSITDDEKDEHYKAIISSYPDLEVDSYWGRHAVAFCIEQGYFNGVYVELEVEGEEIAEKLPFGTEENATRLEIVRVLANMVTDIGESVYNNNFHDIDENSVGTEAIAWALDNEITKGTEDGDNFSPDEPVKRQEMAMFFTRFLTSIDLELPEVFEEVEFIDSSSIWSNPETIESIRILQQAGIIKGHLDGRFDPDGNITRAQFATMLENFVLLLAEENQIK